jgi:Xaa-Pro aminopeptidase
MLDDYYWEPPTREELARQNLIRLQGIMEEQGVDAVIVNRSDNLRYVTGIMPTDNIIFTNRQAALVTRTREDPVLFAASHYARHIMERFWIKDLRSLPRVQDTWPGIFREALADSGVNGGVVALDPFMYYATARKVEEDLGDYEVIDGGELLAQSQMLKSPGEIEAIEAACALGEISLQAGFESIREGVTEIEVAAKMSYAALAAGAEGLYARRGSLVSSGHKLSVHQESPTRKRLRLGEFILLDVGPMMRGYYCDFARTVFLGDPTPKQRAIYQTAYRSIWAAIDNMRPGVHGAELHALAKEVIDNDGFSDDAIPLVAHGVGTTAQEPPYIVLQEYKEAKGASMEAKDVILEPNMILALSNGVFVPGVGGCRFEETVLVNDTGYRVLSRTPYPRRKEMFA